MARTRRSKGKPAANAAAVAAKPEAEEVEQEEVEEPTVVETTEPVAEEVPEVTLEEGDGDAGVEVEPEEKETPEAENVEVKDESTDNISEQQDDHSKLIEAGCTEEVANLVRDLVFDVSVMTYADMSSDVVTLLCDFPVDKLDSALKEFVESDFSTIKGDKSTHLRSLLKAWKDDSDEQKSTDGSPKTKQGNNLTPKRHDPKRPDEAKIKELLERTGYKHEVTTKGRIYGPPPDVEEKPEHKQEIFVGKLARDVYEDELVPLFEKYGKIYDIKILIEPNSGSNRGFAFVSYCNKESLFRAAAELNDHEIRPGKKMKVNVSIPNQRLFVGNVPKQKSKEEILEEFKKVSDGLEDVIVYSNPDDETKKNRGFAFLEYASHTAAANARQKFLRGIKAFGNSHCTGDWADPEEEPDEETMKTVKILHVRNLSSDVTEEQLKKHFSAPLGEDGLSKIFKVKKVKYNAFIEFKEREDAITVLEAVNDTELGKQKIQVVLAKPNSDKDKRDGRRSRGGAGPRGGGGRGRNNSMSPRGGRGAMGGGRGRGWGSGYGGPQNMSGGGWGGGFSGGGGGYGGYGPQNSSGGWGGNYGGPGWGNGPMHGGNWGSGPNPMRGPGGMGMSRGGSWGGPGGPPMRMGGPGGNWGGPGNWGGSGGNWSGGRGGWSGGGMRGGFGGGMRGGFGGRGGGNRGGRGGRGQKRPRGGGQGRSNGDGNGAAKKPRVEGSGAGEKSECGLNNEGPAADWGNQPIAQQPLSTTE